MSKPTSTSEEEIDPVTSIEAPFLETTPQTSSQPSHARSSPRSSQAKTGALGTHSPFNPSETAVLNNVFEKIFDTLDKIVTKMGIESPLNTSHTPEALFVSARTDSPQQIHRLTVQSPNERTIPKSTRWLKSIDILPKDEKERILWIEQLTNLGKVSGVTVQEVAADILGKIPQADQGKVLGLFNNMLSHSWETLKQELEKNLLSPQYAAQCELEYYQTFQEEKETTQEWFDRLLRIGSRCRSSISQSIDRRFYDGLKYSVKEFLNTKFPDAFNKPVSELLPAANNFERGRRYNQGLEVLKRKILTSAPSQKQNWRNNRQPQSIEAHATEEPATITINNHCEGIDSEHLMIEYGDDFDYCEYPQDAETFLMDQAAEQLAAERRAREEANNYTEKTKRLRGRPPIARLQPPKTKASFGKPEVDKTAMDVDETNNLGTNLIPETITTTPKITEKEFSRLNAAKQEQYLRTYKQKDGTLITRSEVFKPEEDTPTIVPAEQEAARSKVKESAASSLVKKLLATEVSATMEELVALSPAFRAATQKQLQATAKGEILILEDSNEPRDTGMGNTLNIYSKELIKTYQPNDSTLMIEAPENITLTPSSTTSYQTGITFNVPEGHSLQVESLTIPTTEEGVILESQNFYPGCNHQLKLEFKNTNNTTQTIPKNEVMAVLNMKTWNDPNNERKLSVPYKWPDHPYTTASERKFCPRAEVKIKGELITAYIDNGSGLSFISEQLAESLGIKVDDTKKITFLTVNGEDKSRGITEEVPLSTRRITINWKFQVIAHPRIKLLLGNDWLYQMNAVIRVKTNTLFISRSNKYEYIRLQGAKKSAEDGRLSIATQASENFLIMPLTAETQLEEEGEINQINHNICPGPHEARILKLLDQNRDIVAMNLNELPGTNYGEFAIELEHGKESPINCGNSVIPYHLQTRVQAEMNKMLDGEIITKSQSSWNFKVVVVGKKGGKIRICVNFKPLNAITIKNLYPLPLVQTILDALEKGKIFSSLDLMAGYHQIRVKPEDQNKTAFNVTSGRFQYKRLPFGVCNAPSYFQEMMNHILGDYLFKFVVVYLDDILIYSENIKDHLEHLTIVIQLLRKFNLMINHEKCQFGYSELGYLGHIIGEGRIRPDESNLNKIKLAPIPREVKGVRAFLGLTGYYRIFIEKYSKIAKPLTTLLKKDIPFEWNNDCNQAYTLLKEKLIAGPVLINPDFSKEFILSTDASNYALGAVLGQLDDKGIEHPIRFWSQTLSKTEQNYGITQKEALAIVRAVTHFKVYLMGKHFTVLTDHSAAKAYLSNTDPSPQQFRWMTLLSAYDFTIVYRPGNTNGNADFMSRIPDVTATERTKVSKAKKKFEDEIDELIYYFKLLTTNPNFNLPYEIRKRSLNYAWRDNTLYRIRQMGNNAVYSEVPEIKNRIGLLHAAHNAQGHFNMEATYNRLKYRYWWPSMAKEVQKYIAACGICAQNQPQHASLKETIRMAPNGIFDRWGIDYVGPLPITHQNNQYILVMTEMVTRWAIAVPVPDNKANTTASQILYHLVLQYGIPRHLISDRGTHFTSKVVKKLEKKLGIKHILTAPYTPQSNGQTEKLNGTLCNALKKECQETKMPWDKTLYKTLWSYRSKTHTQLEGKSPFYMMFGTEPNQVTNEKQALFNLLKRYDRPKQLDLLFLARMQIIERKELNQQQKLINEPLKIGDPVMIYNHAKDRINQSKLINKWVRGYKVYNTNKAGTYLVGREDENSSKYKWLNYRKVKFDPSRSMI
jgi:hypothetical protein